MNMVTVRCGSSGLKQELVMIQMRIHNITPHKIASTNNFPVEDAECCL